MKGKEGRREGRGKTRRVGLLDNLLQIVQPKSVITKTILRGST